MNPCDPDILTSYVDGALSEADRRRVAAHLPQCPPCEETVRAHQVIKQRLASGAALIVVPTGLATRVGSALDKLPPPDTGGFHWGNGGGGGGGTGGIGGAGGLAKLGLPLGLVTLITAGGLWFARPMWQPRPVDVRAMMWHHRDAINPPASASLRTADGVEGRRWLTERLGEASAAPPLAARLRGVGICRVDDVPSAIWMYDAGRPVSLIEVYRDEKLPAWTPALRRVAPGGAESRAEEVVTGTYGGYNAVIWKTGGRTYALVSDLPPDRLMRLLENRP